MTSQLVIFRAFLFIFFRPPDPRSEKNSCKSTNKKIRALPTSCVMHWLFQQDLSDKPAWACLSLCWLHMW